MEGKLQPAREPPDVLRVLGGLVAFLAFDLDQRRDWLGLFPFLRTRRPETYAALLDAVS